MSTPPDQSVPPLAPNQVHIWRLSLEVDPSALAAYRLLLSPDERQRAERVAFPEPRRRFIVARANLRQLLGCYACRPAEELRFAYGPSGKPELVGGGWHFNVSHSGEQALIAVAMREGEVGIVGVDLEMIRSLDYEAVARNVLMPADILTLVEATASTKADVFFRLWVRHEARVKAMGTAIGMPAKAADVPVYDLDVGQKYRGAVATGIKDVRIEIFNC